MQNQLFGPCVSELNLPEKAALGRNCDFPGFWVWGIENPGEAPKTPGMGSIGGSGGLGGASPKGIREKGTPKGSLALAIILKMVTAALHRRRPHP